MSRGVSHHKRKCTCGHMCDPFYDEKEYEANEKLIFLSFSCVKCLNQWEGFILNKYFKNPFLIEETI